MLKSIRNINQVHLNEDIDTESAGIIFLIMHIT